MINGKSLFVYGLSTGVVMTITAIVIYFADLELMTGMHFIICIPLMAGVIINGFAFSKTNQGYVTFRQVFENCFYSAMVAVSLLVLWQLVSLVAIPERIQKYMDNSPELIMQRNRMTYRGKYNNEQIDRSMHFVGIYMYAVSLFRQVFYTLLIGTVFSLIAAAVVDTNGTRPEEETAAI